MNIIFMGTPAFAVPVLEMLNTHHIVKAVFTAPSKKAGRSRKETDSPIYDIAIKLDLPILQPVSLNSENVHSVILESQVDVVIVAAYGLFIPERLLDIPTFGCWNIHPSLLPKYRGPSPVITSILNRDITTGVSLMKLDKNMDSGPIIAQQTLSLIHI
mgnify:CR=1 FL=1